MSETNGTNGSNGHTPPKTARKLSPEQAADLVARWARGGSMKKLAPMFGVTVQTGYNYTKAAGA